ncbi:YciI family protein [Amnibacterium sp. CER49]|uniref:YciI family protein n=1 Tax=Amnibacterium sp. CER49 TaxID=3039161 RepID=UPI002448626B|nr:YciI family protein [Amnibacterium sp. CER49]MDH2445166.1 YciI family protein [Amnibacterium sp. CER49]
MPQYAVLIWAADSAHAPEATSDDLAESDEHAARLRETGTMTAAYAFTPREHAVSIRAEGVTPGPFVDAEQAIAGLFVLEAPDLDTALELAASTPAVRSGGGVEVRPIHSGGPVEAG